MVTGKNLEKKDLNNKNGVRIGFIYKLLGKIGYVTETKDFQKFQESFEQIKEESKSEVIVIDASKLVRWDTLSLKVIFPTIISINHTLSAKGKPLIGIIGARSSDAFDAAQERHRENGSDLVPWFDSLEDYVKKYELEKN